MQNPLLLGKMGGKKNKHHQQEANRAFPNDRLAGDVVCSVF
jgi:hypothetical protein